MTPAHTVFLGCSYTEGVGLPGTISNENLWVNVLHSSCEPLATTILLNLGAGGSTNGEIFQRAIKALADYNCRFLFVAWTSLYRYKFSLGVELYDVRQYWSATDYLIDVSVNPDITFSKKYLTDIKNKFFALHHDHGEIVKILTYTGIIASMCQKLGVQCYFINNILPWDLRYFDHVSDQNRKPSDTTPYTQQLLNADTRDDEEFFKIYDRVHQEYVIAKGPHEPNWLNLDLSFKDNFVSDLGDDGIHPGLVSHGKFGHYLVDRFKKNTGNKKI